MGKKILRKLTEYFWEIALIIIVFLLFIINLKPGDYLSGWDNLQTELYPILGIKRAIFAVWQEYQSLGLVSGMAHAADLTRACTVYLMSLFLPNWLVRYTLIFLLYALGGLGVFSLILHSIHKKSVSFYGAIFYLLNFGTIQIFFLPYEAFIYLFAFLPWQIFITIRFFEVTGFSRRIITLLIWIFLLATPQAYVQTNFIVVAICLAWVVLPFLFKNKGLLFLKKLVLFLVIVVGINSFWLLPQIYFVSSGGPKITIESKINTMSTYDSYMQNVEKGTFSNLIHLEGYYLAQLNRDNIPLFSPWIFHRSNPLVTGVLLILTAIALFGIISIKRHKKVFISSGLLILLLFCSSMLLVDQFPFREVGEFFRRSIIFNQLFRSAFTKFIIPYVLVLSYFTAWGIHMIANESTKRLKLGSLLFVLALGILFFPALPAFQGHLFSSEMKVKIPSVYHELFNYLRNNHKDRRIALFPHTSFWGWFHHAWGYNGSGFIWYGIEQPIIARTFDVWSRSSEEYYWQVNQALINRAPDELEMIFQKYQVGLILSDTTILGSRTSAGNTMEKYLNSYAVLIKDFGPIKVYARQANNAPLSPVQLSTNRLPIINQYEGKIDYSNRAYEDWGNYLSRSKALGRVIYPYESLSSNGQGSKNRVSIVDDQDYYTIQGSIPNPTSDWKTYQPSIATNEAEIFDGFEIRPFTYLAEVPSIRGNNIVTRVPKTLFARFNLTDLKPYPCSIRKGTFSSSVDKDTLTISAENGATVCFEASHLFIDGRFGYLVKIKNVSHVGKPVLFYVIDKTTKLTKVEVLLNNKNDEYLILKPGSSESRGYTFFFQVGSYERQKTVHSFGPLEIYLFPVDTIQDIYIQQEEIVNLSKSSMFAPIAAEKINYSTYALSLEDAMKKTIVLNQAYDDGWEAYRLEEGSNNTLAWIHRLVPFIHSKRIGDHVLVNGWANGWSIEDNTITGGNFVLVFLPQYLEYIGLFIICLIVLAPAIPHSKTN